MIWYGYTCAQERSQPTTFDTQRGVSVSVLQPGATPPTGPTSSRRRLRMRQLLNLPDIRMQAGYTLQITVPFNFTPSYLGQVIDPYATQVKARWGQEGEVIPGCPATSLADSCTAAECFFRCDVAQVSSPRTYVVDVLDGFGVVVSQFKATSVMVGPYIIMDLVFECACGWGVVSECMPVCMSE